MDIFIIDKDLYGTVVNRSCPSYFKERSFEFTAIRTNTKIIKYEKKFLAFVSFLFMIRRCRRPQQTYLVYRAKRLFLAPVF